MEDSRKEFDALGEVTVPNKYLWGAQTQRAIENFAIGNDKMPKEVIDALLLIKKCAARTNGELNLLDQHIADAIIEAVDEVSKLSNRYDHFPLVIWQTGSGTQTNMNVNEVIANKAILSLGGKLGSKNPVHPNDHVNMGQSSNDIFPTAMHIATVRSLHERLIPAIQHITHGISTKEKECSDVIKIGRTHMQSAVPIRLSDELSTYRVQIENSAQSLLSPLEQLLTLAQGGTAVGTGLNTHTMFAEKIIKHIAQETGYQFKPAANKFALIAGHDIFITLSGVLSTLAAILIKLADDIRLLACSFKEITIASNEPGSSIMPGKVNPTQCEALIMVSAQVISNHNAITLGGLHSNLQLNVSKPLIIHNMLHSINILSDAMISFTNKCINTIKPHHGNISAFMEKSLMLVTALTPHIGYDRAAQIAQHAEKHSNSLKESATSLGYVTEEQFDLWVNPKEMV